jgi:hypothetical protein
MVKHAHKGTEYQLRGNTSPGGSAWRFAIDHPPLGHLLLLSGNDFSGSGEEGGEGAGVTKGKRKREADRLKQARALVSTRQAHERTHACTHTQIDLWTGRDRRTNPRTTTKKHAQTQDGQGGNRRIQHIHAHSYGRVNASKSCLTLGWLKKRCILFIKHKTSKLACFSREKGCEKRKRRGGRAPPPK